jgi:AcrR family transcriptional regulator
VRTHNRVTKQQLLDAAAVVVGQQGAPATTLASVARALGTSIRPVRNRVADRSHLLADLWFDLSSELEANLRHGLEATTDHPAPLLNALEQARTRSSRHDATAELLLFARFDPLVHEAVTTTLAQRICEWTTPGEGLHSEQAARNGFALALIFGMLIGSRHRRAATLDLRAAVPVWAHALTPAKAQRLPEQTATFIDEYPSLAPTDPALDILLNTALELVSQHGFDQVTTAQIAQAAGFTEGLVFSRYTTKLEMVLDATRRQNEAGLELNNAFVNGLRAEHPVAIAEAVLAREAQLPGREVARSMALEQIRLGWHHPELADAQQRSLDEFRAELLKTVGWDRYESETDFFLQFALSWGLYLMPFLNPEVHRLPYDAVLGPLYAAFESRRSEPS